MKLSLEIDVNDADILNLLETEDLKPSELHLALTPMTNGTRQDDNDVSFRPELFWFVNNEYMSAEWPRITVRQIKETNQ